MRTNLLRALICAVAGLLAMNAQAQLFSTDGGLTVYDVTHNVIWTSDGNLFATQAASYSGGAAALVSAVIGASGGHIGGYTLSAYDFTGFFARFTGQMNYYAAQAWVNYLNATNYGGSNQWALPITYSAGGVLDLISGVSNPAENSSQLAELFYAGLGQVQGSSITTTHNANYSLFSNVQNIAYMSGTLASGSPGPLFAGPNTAGNPWLFGSEGSQFVNFAWLPAYYVLAVRPGPPIIPAPPGIKPKCRFRPGDIEVWCPTLHRCLPQNLGKEVCPK